MMKKILLLFASIMVMYCQNKDYETPGNAILLKNGNVVDAENGTVRKADVLIRGSKIARISDEINEADAKVIDCTGKIITAGFVDSHVHVESSMVLPEEFGNAILPFGTTALIADPHEAVNVGGVPALRLFIEQTRKSAVDMFVCVPSSVPATPYETNGAGKFLAKDMAEFLDMDEVVALGEVMCYVDVYNDNPEILDKIALFLKHGKVIDGHTAGMPQEMMEKYISAGVQNDHECTDVEGMMQRYGRGMNIYCREGSAARNAYTLLRYAKDNSLNLDRFAFCTDDKHLATIAEEGHISYIVRMARQIGFEWPEIAKMASYNPCRFYKLEKRGNIKEEYLADIVVTDSEADTISYVIKDGILVAENQKSVSTRKSEGSAEFQNTVSFKDLTADDFAVPEALKNIAIGLIDREILTERIDLKEGEWKSLNMLANVERHGKNGNISVCLLKGFGIRNGALATSVSHDSHNVICAGDNPGDMAVACNRLKDIGGGYVIVSNGKVAGELPLPAFGLMSTASAASTSAIIDSLHTLALQMGVNSQIDPFITLSFAALPVIPSLRLLDTGLFDCTTNTYIAE